MKAERRTLPEQIGSAINSSHLEHNPRHETSIDLVGALGAAANAVSRGADIEDVQIGASRSVVYASGLDPRDVLAGELGPLLWHIRFGGQHGQVPRAIALFGQWMLHRAIIAKANPPIPAEQLRAFAARVLHEWLSDRCQACAGSGKQERTAQGRWVRPLGRGIRNAQLRGCRICGGNGRALPRHAERWRQLGITRDVYEGQRWERLFTMAHTWLQSSNLGRLMRPLTAELERRIRRP